MRAKITKILAALMAVTMLFSFAACGGDNGDETTTTTTKKSDDVVATETVTDDNGEAVTDANGEEVTVTVEDKSSENDSTTKADGKTTTKNDKTTKNTSNNNKTTKPNTSNNNKTTKPNTSNNNKTTKPNTSNNNKTTKPSTTKTNTNKTPSTNAEILKAYSDAVAKVNSSKAGFTKTRSTTASKFNVPTVLSAFKGTIEGFMGIGQKNEYSVDVAKGTFGGKIKKDASGKDQAYYYLTNVKLTTSDIKSATCNKSGDNYIITINLKDGTSQAGNGVSTKNNSPLDRSGLCVGDRDIDIFDHKTGEIMYSAIEGTAKKTTVTESTSNAKIVATVNASSGKLSNIKITFDLKCNMKINLLGNHDLEAAGATTVTYKNFKW